MQTSRSTPNLALASRSSSSSILMENCHGSTAAATPDKPSSTSTDLNMDSSIAPKKSFESSISTTVSTNNRVLNSIFTSSANGGSDADGEEEDFMYWSSATDPDTPSLLSPTILARGGRGGGGLKRKFSYRNISSKSLGAKRSSYGSFQKTPLAISPHSIHLAHQPDNVDSFSSAAYSRSVEYSVSGVTEQTGLLHDTLRPRTDVEGQKYFSKKRHIFVILGCVLFVVTGIAGLILVAFTFQPLQFIGATDIVVITRSVNMFEVGLMIEGFNPNIVSISLNETDLDVFASRGINTNLSNDTVYHRIRPSQELLGHVRSFNSSVSFPPLSSSSIQCQISIIDPSNTLGRFIYMTFPHTILVRGEIGYSSPLDFTKSVIPVCIYQQLLSEAKVNTYSCL